MPQLFSFPTSLRIAAACLAVLCFGESPTAHAQRITVKADAYQQAFEGVGSSIPLFLARHFVDLNAEQRAEALDLIVRDNNLLCLQDYPEFRLDDPRAVNNNYYTRRVQYLQAAKAIRPEMLLSQTFSIFPDDLRKDTTIIRDGESKLERRLDFRRAGIYDEVAQWYFETLEFYHDNGLDIDVVNLVNEPDFIVWRYGFDTDAERGTAELFTQGVDKLRALIDAANAEGDSIPQPRIMGPSTIGPKGAVNFINYYKANFPAAWDNIDIVAYHQYVQGVSATLSSLQRAADGKPLWQSEMHTNRGDDLPALDNLEEGHRGVLSLSRLMTRSLNTGANAWFYFVNIHPGPNPGLLLVSGMSDGPQPWPHYYAFKQIGSAQPMGARVVERQLASIRSDGDVLALREEGSDTVYVHYANYTAGVREVELEIVDASGDAYPLRAISQRVSDADSDDEDTGFVDAGRAMSQIITAGPYSLNTFTVVIGGTSGLSPKPAVPAPFTTYQTGDEVAVQLDEGFETAAVRLADVSGRVLEEVRLGAGQREVRLPAAGLAPGVYLVSARTSRGWATARVGVR